MGAFTCFSCLYEKKRRDKVRGIQVQRKWPDITMQDPKVYLPQVGDLVTYIPQAHEEFICQNFDVLRFSKGFVFPFEQEDCLLRDNTCLIKNIKYQFPLNPHKPTINPNVLMKMQLEIVEPQDSKGQVFCLTYFHAKDSDFLIPRERYSTAIKNLESIQKETLLSVKHNGIEKPAFLSDRTAKELVGPFCNSYWHSLVLFDHSDDAGHGQRRSRRESDKLLIYVSPWDIVQGDLSKKLSTDEELSREACDRMANNIGHLWEANQEIGEYFLYDVEKKRFPEYLKEIPFEMNISRITGRLAGDFYRHKAAIISDIELIRLNCERYNGKNTEITRLAVQLTEDMINVINKELGSKSSITMNTSLAKTRSQRRKNSNFEEEEKTAHKDSFSDEKNIGKPQQGREFFGINLSTSLIRLPSGQESKETEKRVLRSGSQDLKSDDSDKKYSKDEMEFTPVKIEIGRMERTRSTRSSEVQALGNKPETYLTRLRSKPKVEEEVPKLNTQLSREERFQRRLKAKGDAGDEEPQLVKKDSAEFDITNKIDELGRDEVRGEGEERHHQGAKLKLHMNHSKRVAESGKGQSREINRYGKRPAYQNVREEVESRREGRPTRLASIKGRMLRKTDTMMGETGYGQGEEGSDGSESVGERRPRKNERGYKRKLRNVQRTYTQYFDGDEEDLLGESEEDEQEGGEVKEEEEEENEEEEEEKENGGEIEKPKMPGRMREKRRNGNDSEFEGDEESSEKEEEEEEDEDEWDEMEKTKSKVRLMAGRESNEENGEHIQVKRYNTRHREKI